MEVAVSASFWTNADDRLALDPLCRVEGGNGVVEGRDVADVRPQSSVPHPPDELTQLGAIGYDNEVNRQAASGPTSNIRRKSERAASRRGPSACRAAIHCWLSRS